MLRTKHMLSIYLPPHQFHITNLIPYTIKLIQLYGLTDVFL